MLFQTELHLPPIAELKIRKEQVRALYNKMCEVGGHAYENLELQGETATLSTRRGEDGLSRCRFGPYLIGIEERNPGYHLDEFVGIVKTVLRGFDTVPLVAQRCSIECLAQVLGSPDSVVLLAGKVANVLDKIDPFERPPSYFGVRFRFYPAVEVGDEEERDGSAVHGTEASPSGEEDFEDPEIVEHKGFMDLRFETYNKDVKQIWMRVAGAYPFEEPTATDDLATIEENLRHAYVFLTEKSKRFLDQFDAPSIGSSS